MHIVYARMPNYGWVSVPSDAVVRELHRLGHTITVATNISNLPSSADFVISLYESVTLLGDVIAKKLNCPHYSHIEVLPPWRVIPNCDYKNYGLDQDDPEVLNFNKTQPYYMQVGKVWSTANIKSLSTPVRYDMHKKLFPNLEDVLFRFPSIDTRTISAAKQMMSPKKNPTKIITIARATAIKRYDLLLEVINQLKTKATWSIIGEGPMIEKVQKGLTNKNITLDIMGPKWGWAKWYELMKAKVMLYAMGGMPPMEAAFMDVLPIAIEQQPTRDIPEFDCFMQSNYKESIPIFKHNDLTSAATLLDSELQKPVGESLAEWDTVNKFMNGETGITPSEINAKNLSDVLQKYV